MNVMRRLMTADEFLDWRQSRPGRWELVSGTPIQMMAGAKQRHDRIVVNLIAILKGRLKGGPCRPWSADIATRTVGDNVRQPDVTVDCGPIRDEALESTTPTVVFEVLSPSTRTYDLVRKVDEYKNVPSLRHIVLIDPDQPRVVLWSRTDECGPWRDVELADDLELSLDFSAIGTRLTLAEVYEDLEFSVS